MDAIAIRISDWEMPCNVVDVDRRQQAAPDRTDVLRAYLPLGHLRLYPPPINLQWIRVELPIIVKSEQATATASTQTDVADLKTRFIEQADKWQRHTEHLSSPSQMMMHPSYQAILGMARVNEDEIIRIMLHDLQENRRPWFWALSYLTKDNPIKPTDAGRLDKMIGAWVEWGKRKGIF